MHGDPEQLGSGVLAVGIVLGLPDTVDRDRVEPVDGVGVAVDGSLDERGLRVEVGAGEREEHAVFPAADPGDRDLGRRRWRRAAHAADLDAVVTQVGQRGGVQVCGHVGVEVGGFTDLVEQLSGDGVSGDGAAGARVLGDHRGTVGVDFGDREPRLHEVGDGPEPGEVAAGRLWPAFDDVSGGDRAGERVVVIRGPTPPPGGGTDDHGGVGDPAGDDDVGAVGQRPRDAEPTQVGVGRQGLVRPG